jgi:pimeloyl-ACP methyl ester carboxylesterase
VKATKDVGKRQAHHYYFRNGTMDFAVGWILGYCELGGLSVGEVYDCLNRIKDGDPASWAAEFLRCAAYEESTAEPYAKGGDARGAGMKRLAASVAARAALHMLAPESAEARAAVASMEGSFQQAIGLLGLDLEPREFPYTGGAIPGYASQSLAQAERIFVVIGGGDTFREDLYFFGGAEALRRGYKVLLVDLPGQGTNPYKGMRFGEGTIDALVEIVDGLRAEGFKGKLILSGYSGGGYFTAKALERVKVDAWIASTPIIDMKRVVEVAIPTLIRGNPDGWLQKAVLSLAGKTNHVLEASLKKYAWQFGPRGFADLLDLFERLGPVHYMAVDVPSLFLIGLSEDAEGLRQAQVFYDSVKVKRPESAMITFPPESGADAHCQVNNLRWAQHHIFRWLESIGL